MSKTDAEVTTMLRAATRFRRLQHVRECESTQALAAADAGADAAVWWADHQTGGRGRQGRAWHDQPGADLAVTFRVDLALPNPVALPAIAPLCVLQAIEPRLGRPLRLKWPNDLLLDERKLAGVLIDAGTGVAGRFLIGIGVNVNCTRLPRELEATATSLALATGREHPRADLLLDLASRLEALLAALTTGALAPLEGLFLARLGLGGQRVVVDHGARSEGVLTRLDFAALTLDDRVEIALGQVRGLRRA